MNNTVLVVRRTPEMGGWWMQERLGITRKEHEEGKGKKRGRVSESAEESE